MGAECEHSRKSVAAAKIQKNWRAARGLKGFRAIVAQVRYQKAEQLANARRERREAEERKQQELKHKQHEQEKECCRQKCAKMEQAKRHAAAVKIQNLWRGVQGKKGLKAMLAKM